ncbi:MAG: hypothetical protein MUE71_02130 [Chitinophagaceae bacterium]|jgi:hypothetical protein|nr:hypothetical protein [Chitinophagaceae bacterium]MCU0405049.1 hypothetical protein [Chitinophagaceae bacterium]
MQYIFWALLLYLLYRFFTGFVWPVYKATTMVKKQFNSMKEQMNQMNSEAHVSGEKGKSPEKSRFDKSGDYIPFEEIKE